MFKNTLNHWGPTKKNTNFVMNGLFALNKKTQESAENKKKYFVSCSIKGGGGVLLIRQVKESSCQDRYSNLSNQYVICHGHHHACLFQSLNVQWVWVCAHDSYFWLTGMKPNVSFWASDLFHQYDVLDCRPFKAELKLFTSVSNDSVCIALLSQDSLIW